MDKRRSSEIGLKFLEFVFKPFLNSGVNLAIFHLSGKVDNFIDKFMTSKIPFVNTSAPSFKNLQDI